MLTKQAPAGMVWMLSHVYIMMHQRKNKLAVRSQVVTVGRRVMRPLRLQIQVLRMQTVTG